ncbi:helix-turn-helix transcriptional regulator [Marinobacter hydrocarbonoclasticus]|nr:helix-turn-helix transcriptional regulator [Marinobacter nauticus]
MPRLTETQVFDPDTAAAPVLGFAIDHGQHDSGWHQHQRGQLLYAEQGCMQLSLPQRLCIVPPTRAVWLPSGLPHQVTMAGPTRYRSLYFDAGHFGTLPAQPKIFEVTPLLQALILRVTDWSGSDLPDPAQLRLVSVLIDEINGATAAALMLPLPTDKRLQELVSHYLSDPGCGQQLADYAKHCGASTKTLTRRFREETGLTFTQWRQQLRLNTAHQWFAQGKSLQQVSQGLGFTSDSAFIQFFKQHTGHTPMRRQRSP